jgi:hypothetical protein
MQKTFRTHKDLLVDVIRTTCGNCYKEATEKRVHVGSIEGFIFCSRECGMDAMKRSGKVVK